MKFEKPSEELIGILDQAMEKRGAERRKMFGSPCYFVNRNMMTGVHQSTLFVRLSEDDKEWAAGEGASGFEPMKGRVMREYMVLPEEVLRNGERLDDYLDRSYEYVSSLPPKEKKK